MVLDIVKVANPTQAKGSILRAVCEDVKVFDRELHHLTLNMVDTLFAANGVGLAAPQIAKGLNLFVMRTAKGLEEDSRDVHIFINPKATLSGPTYNDIEGCLSIPGLIGRVTRYKTFSFTYMDTEGKAQKAALSDLPARIFQHEYDHLQGILFPDRAYELWRPVKKRRIDYVNQSAPPQASSWTDTFVTFEVLSDHQIVLDSEHSTVIDCHDHGSTTMEGQISSPEDPSIGEMA